MTWAVIGCDNTGEGCSRPEAQAFINEWPRAALPDEIAAGNIRALINVGGSLVTGFPETGKLVPALQQLEVFATTEIINNETTELAPMSCPPKTRWNGPTSPFTTS